ncbi:hypothetical protein JHK86_016363 [Glycine max]|nr:hypothetical protein JHK86_016363 [Glycine max]
MIGDSGVGKSSLLLSFTSDAFEDLSPTIGVDFKVKYVTMGGKKLKLAIWDTGIHFVVIPFMITLLMDTAEWRDSEHSQVLTTEGHKESSWASFCSPSFDFPSFPNYTFIGLGEMP